MAGDVGKAAGSPRDWFGDALVGLASEGVGFLAVDCDVAGGTGLWKLRDRFPGRVVQCGISEQAAAGVAAGLAEARELPVVFNTFAVFGARAWEVLRLQAFYNDLPVVVCLSHIGLDVGEDGASAQSLSHYALWRSIPGGHVVAHPCCPAEMEAALRWMLESGRPGVLLTGRSPVRLGAWADKPALGTFRPGRVNQVYKGGDVNVLASGHVVARCVEAAKKLRSGCRIRTGVWSVPSLKPLDVSKILAQGLPVVTVEDHGPAGGLFEAVVGKAAMEKFAARVTPVCVLDWGQSGGANELADHYGIGVGGIMEAVKEALRNG